MQDNKDFTDYFMLFVNTGREHEFFPAFKQLVNNAKLFEEVFPDILQEEIDLTKQRDEEEFKEIEFYDAIKEIYINQSICFNAIVRGEAEKPYVYPVKIRVHCNVNRGDMCMTCGLFLTGGNIELELKNVNPLELIDIKTDQKLLLIKRKIGIVQCGQFEVEFIDQKYIQELFLSPIMKTANLLDDKKEQRFIVRHAFAEGSDVIPNKIYKFYSIPTPSPKNQSLVFYVKKYKEEESDLDNFKLSDNDIKDLEIFQAEDNKYDKIEEKLKDIYNDFSSNLSPVIRYRDDIMFSCDLAFHSILNYWFGKSYERGYIECLIVGDTQTGKTKIATKLINHYRLGVIQGAENATIPGLIGGMTKFESINIMTWGLLPLNNSRLVVLDEMSGINKSVLEELTRIRGEGIAERTIVGGSSSTIAKVRLVWLSNPRKRSMKLYDSGCDMIRELVGKEEDISRFDFILTVSSDEVKTEQINIIRTISGVGTKHIYTSDLCNKLILWVWSRKANNVTFDSGVERLILDYSIEMSKKYTPNFPLILGSTIRLKLAKLSIALAARLFSTSNSEDIFVTENHVAYIYEFLERIYNKPSFGYGEYSTYQNAGEIREEESKTDIFAEIGRVCPDVKSFVINMLTNSRITALEIKDFLKCTKDQSDLIRTKLVSAGFLIKKSSFYVKSDIFRQTLREYMRENK